MNRVTYENPDGTFGINGIRLNNQPLPVQNAFKRLLEYEKTGLDPEQVTRIAKLWEAHREDGEELKNKSRTSECELTDARQESSIHKGRLST